MATEFLEAFRQLVASSGFRFVLSPAEMVDGWRAFVAKCERGYLYGLDEYYNDLALRDLVDVVLTSGQLKQFAEIETLKSSIREIDARFQQLLRDDVAIGDESTHWWKRSVLRKAGAEYADDVLKAYGLSIERME